ncbi:IS630 family transposase [Plantactinospora alkalitolerans]|uniref:IS630 family transposase n=1 Tax=Plantactinospora alkalitolerans TaxID=2789879 RepID=UPI002B1F1532|nr:IS630 family transposase [Plantactinospora alkalitolerans]
MQRAWIVLLAAQGWSNREIGVRVGLHYNQVAVWRGRYRDEGMAGLVDTGRPGRPPVYGADDVILLVKTATETPPAPASRWTMEALARRLNEAGVTISASQVWRICQGLDLKPWQYESWMTSHDPDFWVKAADVCGLYVDPPVNAVVWSVDEKTGMRARSRVNPTRPAQPAAGSRPGRRARREFEYRRHGTAVLYAGLNVHDGQVAAWVTDSTRADNFIAFLTDLVETTPNGLELHCIVDNLSAHGTKAVQEFLDDNPHVFLHRTPTHASWLNQVELFFSILQRRLLRYGEFDSVDDLATKVIAFINDYNKRATPFRWTYDGRPLQAA